MVSCSSRLRFVVVVELRSEDGLSRSNIAMRKGNKTSSRYQRRTEKPVEPLNSISLI